MIRLTGMTIDDLEAVVHIHMQAFRGYMNTLLGTEYVHNCYTWFIRRSDTLCVKCEVGGRVAGFAVGAPVGYASAMNRDLMATGLRSFMFHPRAWLRPGVFAIVAARARALLMRGDSNPSGFVLVGIATSPEFRGLGLGAKLLKAFERGANERGHVVIWLSVYETNLSAIKLYERAGWARVDHSGTLINYKKEM